MSPPASHCCRALQRPIIPCRDAVWITDSVLASAFERYCAVSRAHIRNIGNVPGPLESQRRLGRRRMGIAGTLHCPPTPASWAFSAPLNLSQWSWEPPSLDPSAERTPLNQDDAGGDWLSTVLPSWLNRSIPHDDGGQPVDFPADLADTALTDAVAIQGSRLLETKMEAFRQAAMFDSPETLVSQIEEVSHQFQQAIVLGEMPPEDVLPLLGEVLEILGGRVQEKSLRQRLSLSLCRAVLTGLKSSRVFSPSLLDAPFWNTFLTHISTVPADDELCDLFVEAMIAMPEAHLPQVSEGVLRVLNTFFSAWSCSQAGVTAPDITQLLDVNILGHARSALSGSLRHAKGIARALRAVNRSEPDGFLEAANRLVLDQAAASTTGQSVLRYTWLCVLAQMPRVRSNFIFNTAATLYDPSMQTATRLELCSLLLMHWNSASKSRSKQHQSPRDLYRTYKLRCGNRDEVALSSLFVAISRNMPRALQMRLYKNSWALLGKLDRQDDVLSSLQSDAQTNKIPVHVFEQLAFTSENPHIAISLRDLWARRVRRPNGPEWNPNVFLKYTEDIVSDPQMSPKTIWRILDIGRFSTDNKELQKKTRRGGHGTYAERRVEVVEKAITAFTMATHLPDRVAFRHVSQGFLFIKMIRGHVPFSVIRNIYHVVTRDLVQRRPGRTKRLLWFLKVVQDHYGFKISWTCRLVLRQWRSRLTRVWISMGGNRMD